MELVNTASTLDGALRILLPARIRGIGGSTPWALALPLLRRAAFTSQPSWIRSRLTSPMPMLLFRSPQSSLRSILIALLLSALTPSALARPQCSDPPGITSLGGGTAGTAGIPELVPVGSPIVGQALEITLAGAKPASAGLYFYGDNEVQFFLPAFGATLVVGAPLFSFPFQTDGSGRADELAVLSLIDLSLCGMSFPQQAVVVDGLAQGGLAFTDGLRVEFGRTIVDDKGPVFVAERFAAATLPASVASGDLNRDGVADLVVSSPLAAGSELSILLGNGDGTFQAAQSLAAANGSFAAVIADLNQDALADLAVTVTSTDSVWLYAGLGDGTFAAPSFIPVGDSPLALVTTDIDGNGIPDLVTANQGSDDISVALGLGGGAFATPLTTQTGDSPTALVAAEWNQDGIRDLAVTHVGSDDLVLLLGNGDGTFMNLPSLPTGGSPKSVAAGDLDQNGLVDIAVLDGIQVGGVDLYFSLGGGVFAAPVRLAAERFPSAIAIADLEQDGLADMVVSNTGSDTVSVFSGTGAGGFGPARSLATVGLAPLGLTLADFDADGQLDVAVANGSTNDVSILLGPGPGAYDYGAGVAVPDTSTTGITTGDIDQDGRGDVVATTFSNLFVYLGQDDGTYQLAFADGPGGVLGSPRLADLDDDGLLDLAAEIGSTGTDEIVVYRGLGDGTFFPPTYYSCGSAPLYLDLADVNGDDALDLLSMTAFAGLDYLCVRLNDGLGNFGSEQLTLAAGSVPNLDHADFDEDGFVDVVIASSLDGELQVQLGFGDGTFLPGLPIPDSANPHDVLSADIDRDGHVDIVLADGFVNSGQLRVYLGRGDGTFLAPIHVTTGAHPGNLRSADLNQDGAPDLVHLTTSYNRRSTRDGGLSVLLGRGDGTFEGVRTFGAHSALRAFSIDDMNQDGRLDAVIALGNFTEDSSVIVHHNDL